MKEQEITRLELMKLIWCGIESLGINKDRAELGIAQEALDNGDDLFWRGWFIWRVRKFAGTKNTGDKDEEDEHDNYFILCSKIKTTVTHEKLLTSVNPVLFGWMDGDFRLGGFIAFVVPRILAFVVPSPVSGHKTQCQYNFTSCTAKLLKYSYMHECSLWPPPHETILD